MKTNVFTEDECREYHYRLWDYITKREQYNPKTIKGLWVDAQDFTDEQRATLADHHNCFACIACDAVCYNCPLTKNIRGCTEARSFFDDWYFEKRDKRLCAEAIRDAWSNEKTRRYP